MRMFMNQRGVTHEKHTEEEIAKCRAKPELWTEVGSVDINERRTLLEEWKKKREAEKSSSQDQTTEVALSSEADTPSKNRGRPRK